MADARAPTDNPAKTSDKNNDESSSDKDIKYDKKLDFYSDKFDPLVALKCKSLRPPVPKAKTFDNLAMFDSYLKKSQRDGASSQEKPISKAGSSKQQQVVQFERRFEPHQMPVKSTRVWKTLSTVFSHMESNLGKDGMLGVLENARTQNLRLTVTIRHSHGIRGVCFAYLSMYDKYWNMTLTNVQEYWIRKKNHKAQPAFGTLASQANARYFPRVRTINLDEASKCQSSSNAIDYEIQKLAKMLQSNMYGRNNKNSELCHRRVNELLVRGEQVVFIAIAQGQQS